jgi:hypothetical protein
MLLRIGLVQFPEANSSRLNKVTKSQLPSTGGNVLGMCHICGFDAIYKKLVFLLEKDHLKIPLVIQKCARS